MAAITTGMPVTEKEADLRGEHAVGDTYKIVLLRANAALGRSYGPTSGVKYADITAATSDEVASGGGYTTGGNTLASFVSGPNNATPTVITGTGAWVSWATTTWTSATFTTAGCAIYNNTHANKIVRGWYDFGGDKTVTAGTLTVTMPTAGAGTAIVCIN
jgi:hypothetical protein